MCNDGCKDSADSGAEVVFVHTIVVLHILNKPSYLLGVIFMGGGGRHTCSPTVDVPALCAQLSHSPCR
jgi:hypothetical protein